MRNLSGLFQLAFRLDNPSSTEDEAACALERARHRWRSRVASDTTGTEYRISASVLKALKQEPHKSHTSTPLAVEFWKTEAGRLADELIQAKDEYERVLYPPF